MLKSLTGLSIGVDKGEGEWEATSNSSVNDLVIRGCSDGVRGWRRWVGEEGDGDGDGIGGLPLIILLDEGGVCLGEKWVEGGYKC